MVHNGLCNGMITDAIEQDAEGLQTMRILGKNMAWLLKCIEVGKKQGIVQDAPEERYWTNFIR